MRVCTVFSRCSLSFSCKPGYYGRPSELAVPLCSSAADGLSQANPISLRPARAVYCSAARTQEAALCNCLSLCIYRPYVHHPPPHLLTLLKFLSPQRNLYFIYFLPISCLHFLSSTSIIFSQLLLQVEFLSFCFLLFGYILILLCIPSFLTLYSSVRILS